MLRKTSIENNNLGRSYGWTRNYYYDKATNRLLSHDTGSNVYTYDAHGNMLTTSCTTPSPVQVTIRYQYDNHLGSACLELDNTSAIISYEEYHPFGTTSYRAGRNATETSLKRYKYVGKERDEETGLYYYGARYYVAWLCRFVSVDPLQFRYPHYTPYQYAGNNQLHLFHTIKNRYQVT